MKKYLVLFSVLFFVVGFSTSSNAAIIDLTLGEFSSSYLAPGNYYVEYLVGTFSYDLTGESIVSATISGQWGNSVSGTTAHNELWLGSVMVADTTLASPNPYFTSVVPWSYSFTDFSSLADGIVNFYAFQTSEYYVRLGQTNLLIETAATGTVSEPATILLIGTGLIGLSAIRRKIQ